MKKRKRSELEKIKKEKQFGVDTHEPASEVSCPLRWHASYSAELNRRKKPSKGSILLDPEVNHIVLLNADETILDACYIKKGDLIYPGLVLKFPCHKAEIGKQIFQGKEDLPLPTIRDEGEDGLLGGDDVRGVDNEKQPPSKKNKKERRDEKKRDKLKRKRIDENWEKAKGLKREPLRSPQVTLIGSSIGKFARMAALRRRMSPQAQWRKSESPSVRNVTTHFPSPNFARVQADFTRHRPRKQQMSLRDT